MTTYDEVYKFFIVNCRTDSLMLPSTPEQQYDAIRNAVLIFNNKLRDTLSCDDEAELFNRKLNDDEILLISHLLRLTVIKNTLTFKNGIFTTFTKEIGVRNINAQLSSLRDEIRMEEESISNIIFNMLDDSIM